MQEPEADFFDVESRRALERCRTRIREGMASSADYHNLAVAHYKCGAFQEALAALEKARKRTSDEGTHSSGLSDYLEGIVLEEQGRLSAAIEALSRAIERRPEAAMAWYHRGICHFEKGNSEAAEADLDRARKLEPEFLAAHYNLGVVAVANENWDRASQAFRRCLDLDRADWDRLIDLIQEIGRAQARHEVFHLGHRLKNMVGLIGDSFRRLEPALLDGDLSEEDGRRVQKLSASLQSLYEEMASWLQVLHSDRDALEVVDPGELVKKCLFVLSASLSDVDVTKEIGENLTDIICERRNIEEVLQNLFLNALEAIGDREDGEIRVRVKMAKPFHVQIQVEDNGKGIDARKQEQIFTLGYSTKEFGSGVGLAIARRVVARHGGRIEVSSEPGQGSCFTVTLPQVRRPDEEDTAIDLEGLELRPLLFEEVEGLLIRESRQTTSEASNRKVEET